MSPAVLQLDKKRFKKKPSGDAPKWISIRLADLSSEVEIEMEELAQKNGNEGHSIIPAELDGYGRKSINWYSQQIFFLDFDNKIEEGKSTITFEDFIKVSRRYHILPAYCYKTFSCGEEINKWRAVYKLDFTVTHTKISELIMLTLMTIFPEADTQCFDATRLYYGGKGICFENYDSILSFHHLTTNAVISYFTDKDKKNYSRNIKTFCSNAGLEMMNHQPKIIDIDIIDEKYVDKLVEEITAYTINILIDYAGISSNICVFFNGDEIKHPGEKGTGEKKSKTKRKKIQNTNIKPEVIRNFDFTKLENNCEFYREVKHDRYWAYYPELWGMASNLLAVEGGRKRFMESLENSRQLYFQDGAGNPRDWNSILNHISQSLYCRTSCRKCCPSKFYKKCAHKNNMISQVTIKNGYVNIKEELDKISLSEAEEKLENLFNSVLKSEEKKIFIIKGATALGKSRYYLPLIE